MTDQVFVSGLALHAYHGVMQHEAKVGQSFKLDLVLDLDLTQASRSDKLADTVGYDQVVDVASKAFCAKRYRLVEAAAGAVADAVLDPGIGFGKTPEQSMEAIAKLEKFRHFGLPILVGASRKRFINSVSPSEPMERVGGSIAAHVMAYMNGAMIIRTHDVAETIQALRVAAALRNIK